MPKAIIRNLFSGSGVGGARSEWQTATSRAGRTPAIEMGEGGWGMAYFIVGEIWPNNEGVKFALFRLKNCSRKSLARVTCKLRRFRFVMENILNYKYYFLI